MQKNSFLFFLALIAQFHRKEKGDSKDHSMTYLLTVRKPCKIIQMQQKQNIKYMKIPIYSIDCNWYP